MRKPKRIARRDLVEMVGRRAQRLTPAQAAEAWYFLADKLERLGEMDIPKFLDVLVAVRVSTIRGKKS